MSSSTTPPAKKQSFINTPTITPASVYKSNTSTDNTAMSITIPFWIRDPTILVNQKYLLEIFPLETMTFEQKLNAITRLIVLVTIVLYLITQNFASVLVSILSLFFIVVYYLYHKRHGINTKEGYTNPGNAIISEKGLAKTVTFSIPTSQNPFNNVLMTDYEDQPTTKKPAPPAYTPAVQENINSAVKNAIKELNPTQDDMDDKLFRDLGDQYVFDQSMRAFQSMPNTKIPNDVNAFAEFCYGDMVSCKDGNNFACARNLPRHTNY